MHYEIKGGNLPAVICHVAEGESMVTESGGLAWMSPNMKMSTKATGGLGKAFGRAFAGEHMFQCTYTAEGGPGTIAFTSSFPGEIKPVEIRNGKNLIIQKTAFLAAQPGVILSTCMQKKIGAGFFSGEGFILSKLSGDGTAFLEINGAVMEYDLGPGERVVCATGYMAAMDETCTMDIVRVKGVKNVLFGGESLFNTVIEGPGRVMIQTMPIRALAEALMPYLPNKSSS